jgi:hypothetical protein
MKKFKITLLAVFIVSLGGCGGGGENTSPQPWFGDPPSEELPSDSDSDGSNTNAPPVIFGIPSTPIEVVFGQPIELSVTISDPEGGALSVTLYGAPDWLLYDATNGFTGTPNILDNVDGVFIEVSDGENTVVSDTFTISVSEPDTVFYSIPNLQNVATGDEFILSFQPNSESIPVNFRSVLIDNKLVIPLPYPLPLGLDDFYVSLIWESQSYVTLRKEIGTGEELFSLLGDDLQFDVESKVSQLPTIRDTSEFHLKTLLQGENAVVPVVLPAITQRLSQSYSASALLELSALYSLAKTEGALLGLNSVLSSNLDERYTDVGLPDSLLSAVDDVRSKEESLINNRYWNDLLNSAKTQYLGYGSDWGASRYFLTEPISTTFAASTGGALNLNEDGSFTADSLLNNYGVPEFGQWLLAENGLLTLNVNAETVSRTVTVEIKDDPTLFREALMTQANLRYKSATEWMEEVTASRLKGSLAITLSPATEVIFNSMHDSRNGAKALLVERVGTASAEGLSKAVEYVEEYHDLTAFEEEQVGIDVSIDYRPLLFDFILKMPNSEGLIVEGAERWLDLYDAPIVRERMVNEGVNAYESPQEGFSIVNTDWDVIFSDAKQELAFTHVTSGMEYVVTLLNQAAPNNRVSGDTSVRSYSASAIVSLNGVETDRDLIELNLHTKSLCEADGELSALCASVLLSEVESILFNRLSGKQVASDYKSYQDAAILTVPSDSSAAQVTEPVYTPVKIGNDCRGNKTSCWVPNGEPFFVGSFAENSHAQWAVGNSADKDQETWFPIKLSSDVVTVWKPGNGVVHYSSRTLINDSDDIEQENDPFRLAWLCSLVNAEGDDALCMD